MKHLLMACALVLAPGLARSADTKTEQKTQEMLQMHRKMAELHKQAADCIESGRPMKDCHNQAMKECPMMKSGHCPFMGDMGMKKGHKKGMHDMHKDMHEGMMEHESEKPRQKE